MKSVRRELEGELELSNTKKEGFSLKPSVISSVCEYYLLYSIDISCLYKSKP